MASYGKRILIVDDDRHMRSALELSLKKVGAEGDIFSSAEEALAFLGTSQPPYFLIISDLSLPGMDGISFLNEIKKKERYALVPFVIITAYGTVESAVNAMKTGAFDYLLKPFDISDFERTIGNAEKFSLLRKESGKSARDGDNDFICESSAMTEIDSYIKAVSESDATVLITGESGTGKEVVARRIHRLSGRKGRFIGVNCSAIVPTLLESELFGHEKGAFTGAVAMKKGRFEQADEGTILLDEIADMDKNLQAKILRVLQEKTVDRVGGNEPVQVNTRIIAATNNDLEKAVQAGAFREDLFYRLNVIRLHLPPLRERREDVLPLAYYFIGVYAGKYFRTCSKLDKTASEYLVSLSYPGNIRELENMIERAVILAKNSDTVELGHFGTRFSPIGEFKSRPEFLAAGGGNKSDAENNSAPLSATVSDADLTGKPEHEDLFGAASLSLREMEEKMITAALKQTGGNRTKAAEKLGITSRTLRNKIKEYGL